MIDVRNYIYSQTAATGEIPQAPAIAEALTLAPDEVRAAIRDLAAARMLILAPNSEAIWAAPPFAGAATDFHIAVNHRPYWALCIWDALGVAALFDAPAVITTRCADCGESMQLQTRAGTLEPRDGVVHFGVPARRFWENIAFT